MGQAPAWGVEHHGQGVELAISRGVSGKARAVRLLLILIKNKVFGQIGSPLLDIVLQHPEEAALLPLLNSIGGGVADDVGQVVGGCEKQRQGYRLAHHLSGVDFHKHIY